MRDLKKSSGKVSAAILLLLSLILAAPAASSAADTEPPKHCKVCGMDRTVYNQSRMMITYSDGSSAGVCSIHCAAADIKMNRDKQVKSLQVADYASGELIDARTAVWVVGGDKPGVMTPTPKWAFKNESDAGKFIKEHGGKITPFDQVMKASEEECRDEGGMKHDMHAGHDHMHMEAGSQMVFNPAFGDMIYHTHPAGMWMLNYQFMHMNMKGLRDGTSNVSTDDVGYMRHSKYDYMMIPTSMTMNMHMVMAMYGITDKWTAMVMANYIETDMKMIMDMGPMSRMGRGPDDPMSTGGFGDTEIRGMYKINKYLVASLGLSLPTGGIDETVTSMHKTMRAPYDMQLGSGTYDFKPAITYNQVSEDAKWNWGAQAQYTLHSGKNDNDWSYGDSLKINGWLQRAFGPATSWVRLAYSDTGKIRGSDKEIEKLMDWSPMPDADPANYGGSRLDGSIGASFGHGPLSLGIEVGAPLYQDLNGLQMKTDWFLTAGLQVMF